MHSVIESYIVGLLENTWSSRVIFNFLFLTSMFHYKIAVLHVKSFLCNL
jgi:hypothetical protein